jgi:hypothetical protein
MEVIRYRSQKDIMAEWRSFRRKFVREMPIGTLVENSNIDNDEGRPRFANTAPGAIYVDRANQLVNVVKIDGVEGLDGVWTARYTHKK